MAFSCKFASKQLGRSVVRLQLDKKYSEKKIVANMLRLSTIIILSIPLTMASACQMLVPPELLNGCTFSPLVITNPINGYTVNRFNCNEVVNKDVYTEQPYVYFSNADEVVYR